MKLETLLRHLERLHGTKITLKTETFKDANELATFVDEEFGTWENLPRNVIRGSLHPERARKQRSDARSMSEVTFREFLTKVHSGEVEILESFRGVNHRYKFLDKTFGEFEAFATNVVYKQTRHPKFGYAKRQQTCLKRYGVLHHSQDPKIAETMTGGKSQKSWSIHWKTQQSLFCASSYELAFVEWCNSRQEDFLWQPKAFKMPDGKTYRPDAFLPARNLWVDIKGWYPEASRKKCEWFKSIMPNFEVWFKEDLIKHGILNSP